MAQYIRFPGSNVTGTFTPSGLTIAGVITIVPLSSTIWTPLPATPLSKRNAISIQNQNAVEIKLNYSSSIVGYVGVVIPNNGERFYDITDQIVIYAKASSGTPSITVEELS